MMYLIDLDYPKKNGKMMTTSQTSTRASKKILQICRLKDVTYYVCDLIVVYQRKGINNYGWSIMPENLSYTSDFDKVQALCEEGGLDKKFVDRWVEGKTVFRPWW